MTFYDDKAYAINALIAAVEAIEIELGIVPAGVYADVRTRLDILEARINNPFTPSPDVTNPFFIGTTGVTIQAAFGNPNIVLPIPPASPGSLYLQQDGYSGQNVYSFGIDGYWSQVGGGGPSGGIGRLIGDVLAGPGGGTQVATVVGLHGLPVSNAAPTTNQILTWNGSTWIAQTPSSGPITLAGDVTGLSSNNTVSSIQGITISGTPATGYVLKATSASAASWQALSITLAGDVTGVYNSTVVDQITGMGTNQFTGSGTVVNIVATESVLGSGTTNPVQGSVGGATTTDGVTWTTIFSFIPAANTGNDWLISVIGLDATSNPISGDFYRADLQFTTITVSGSPPVLYPATPTPLNIQSNGGGTYSVRVIISTNTVEVQVLGNTTTIVNWSGSLQSMVVS